MENKKSCMRFYNGEEINSMNVIFGKNEGNNWFSREELDFANNINLYNYEELQSVRAEWINNNLENYND